MAGKRPENGFRITIEGSWVIPAPGRMFWATVGVSVLSAVTAALHKLLG